MDLTILDPTMFDSIASGLVYFVGVMGAGGAALASIAVVNARA